MTVEIRTPQGQPLSTADRSNAVAESLRQIARVSRFADRKKGIRSYQTHVKSDPWLPVLFVVCFVIPALAGLVYYGLVASDRFVTEARFALRPAIASVDKAASDDIGTSSGVPKQMIVQDTLIATHYIASRTMIEAIETQIPLRPLFSNPRIDWFSRFDASEPIEEFVRYWADRVHAKVESGSGIVTLTVNAFDPQDSFRIAQAILQESERKVNEISAQARNDAMAESQRELARAEERMTKVRYAVRDLRNRDRVLDAQKANESNLKVIGELRKIRVDLSVQLNLAQRDLGPESRRIVDLKTQIRDLDDNIEKIERQSAGEDPEQRRLLSNALTQFEAYDNERKDAEKYYGKVLAANEKARMIAARQIEFFSMVVPPVLAQSAEQPRRILMISLIAAGAAVLFGAVVLARKFAL